MTDIAGFPYIEIEFTKNGAPKQDDSAERVKTFVADNNLTDLFVVSHGWNNDRQEARALYEDLFGSVREVLDGGAADFGARTAGILGVIWPSKKFRDMDLASGPGAASIGTGESDEAVKELLGELADALDSEEASSTIETLTSLVPVLEDDPSARETFADKIRALLPQDEASADDASNQFFAASAEELFDRLDAPITFQDAGGSSAGGAAGGVGGGAAGDIGGGAAGFGDFFGGAKAAARRLLNYTTYYVMKARAGKVGANGVSEVVAAVRNSASQLKLHFVGHSFGGRVVTAAAQQLGGAAPFKPTTMTLLQAAFSHNGFADDFRPGMDGFFRSVAAQNKVAGPILITHTHNDKANAIAYPIASLIAGQNAADFGGPQDEYGAIGANGAQHTPEAVDGTLLEPGESGYGFEVDKIYNLEADAHINDHGDVTGHAVAYAILTAVNST